jgi:hypothetical protein
LFFEQKMLNVNLSQRSWRKVWNFNFFETRYSLAEHGMGLSSLVIEWVTHQPEFGASMAVAVETHVVPSTRSRTVNDKVLKK